LSTENLFGSAACNPSHLLNRREALGLLATGALTLAAMLQGCKAPPNPWSNEGLQQERIDLAERLLREKFNREFEVIDTLPGWITSNLVAAFCREVGDDSLAFRLELDVRDERIYSDNFLSRKLGRQLEDTITGRLSEHGYETLTHIAVSSASIGRSQPEEIDLDISIEEFNAMFGKVYVSSMLYLPVSLKYPRMSTVLRDTLYDTYYPLNTSNMINICVIKDEDLPSYREHLRLTDYHDGGILQQHRPVSGFKVFVSDYGCTVSEDDYWKDGGWRNEVE